MLIEFMQVVNNDVLAHTLAFNNTNEDLIDFVLALDLHIGDLSFTERLYAALGDSLREELDMDAEEPDRLAPVCMVPDCGCTGGAHA